MPQLSDFLVTSGAPRFQLKAFSALAAGDVAQIIPGGLVVPAKVSDYAAVANAAATVMGGATPNAGGPITQAFGGSLALQAADGSVFFINGFSGSAGIRLNYVSVASANSISVNVLTAGTCTSANMFFLSNGNICITYMLASIAYFTIYNPLTLAQVVAPTALPASSASSLNLVTIPLSGGGFAAFFNTVAASATLAIYSNAGAFVTSVAIATSASAANLGMAQLSNGNIVISYLNATPVYVIAIYTTAVAVAVAAFSTTFAQVVGTVAGNYSVPYFSVLASGFFAFGIQSAAAVTSAMVYSNAGAQQGATYAGASIAFAAPGYALSIINDGISFWLCYAGTNNGSFNEQYYQQISTAGVLGFQYWSYNPFTSTSFMTHAWDASTSTIVSYYGATTYSAFSTFTSAQLVDKVAPAACASFDPAAFVATAANTRPSAGMILVGDGCAFAYGVLATSQSSVAIFKTVNTAIVGSVTAAAAANTNAVLALQSGVYTTTPLKGTYAKTFDHSASNILGNKGTLLNNSIVLKGF